MQVANQEAPPNETTLVNWQAEDLCGINQSPSQSLAANTKSKKRDIEEGHSSNPSTSQPSITLWVLAIQVQPQTFKISPNYLLSQL
ncbi:hypothetical protein KI387_030168, partial [Taxus chinensis]